MADKLVVPGRGTFLKTNRGKIVHLDRRTATRTAFRGLRQPRIRAKRPRKHFFAWMAAATAAVLLCFAIIFGFMKLPVFAGIFGISLLILSKDLSETYYAQRPRRPRLKLIS